MSILTNPILNTDSYKFSHFHQYPKDARHVYSYIEARGSKIEGVKEVVMFGLQPYIQKLMNTVITKAMVDEAKGFCEAHGEPFNYDGWMLIVNDHDGRLPLCIRAVEEGTPVPLSNVMVTVENTDERLPWLTSYVETEILRHVWYGSTVATISRECKRAILENLRKTADDPENEVLFKLHDFGFRGASSFESAALGGAAHLVNFLGTDTVAGIGYAMEHYNSGVCGFSIPASEHSTMTLRGKAAEYDSYKAMVDAYAGPGKVFAVVSDSYDIYNAVENIWHGRGLLDEVKAAGATVVIRPDSGDPIKTPVEIIELLLKLRAADVTINSKGYKVLPSYVRVIQGDGITIDSLRRILDALEVRKISGSNIAFGMGAGLLQKCDRDTFKFAMKASAATIGVNEIDVYKDPVTDSGKRSKRGRFGLVRDEEGNIITVNEYSILGDGLARRNLLRIVYNHNGNRTVTTSALSFDRVRENAKL